MESRIDQLEITIDELNPDILILTEHDLNSDEIARVNIKKFQINAFFSRQNSFKGGVMIVSRIGLEGKQVDIPQSLSNRLIEEKQFELCAYSYVKCNFRFLIVGVYRSPSSDYHIFLDRLSIFIDFFSKKYTHIIIGGDINIDVMKNDDKHKCLKNVLKSHNMRYLVTFPTRITEHSKSAIDNFLITNTDIYNISIEGIVTCLSDHDAQILCFNNLNSNKNTIKKMTKQEVRKFSPANIAHFSDLLKNETWEEVFYAPVEEKYNVFNKIFNYYFELAFPKTLITKKYKKSNWMSKEIQTKKQELIQLTNEYRQNADTKLKKILKHKKIAFKNNIRKTKTKFFENQIKKSSNVQKTVWNIINSEVGKNSRAISEFVLNDGVNVITDPKEISNMFNRYFTNVVKDIAPNNHINVRNELDRDLFSSTSFRLNPVTEHEVDKIISGLKNKHSSGYDEVPTTVLKGARQHLTKVLCHLINSSFVSGLFPVQLKVAKIVPIHKKDDPKNVSNYRPVALLPSVSKVFEKIVSMQLTSYLEHHNLFDDIQHGFRSGRSVISAAVSFIESVIESVDKGEHTTGIFMDLSRAFDSVNHLILIDKLINIGVSKTSLNWFKSFLVNRYQYVEVKHLSPSNKLMNIASDLELVQFGVPQGSILGPLLFVIYLKDINKVLSYKNNNQLYLYADDSNLKITTNSLEQMEIQSFVELENLNDYLKNHNLILNTLKTSFIKFKTAQNTKQENLIIMSGSQMIEEKKSTSFLGLTVDNNLNWNEHVDKVLRKINSGIYALKKMSLYCGLETLRHIYFAYIHSHISFGLCLFGATRKINLDSILKQQKRAIRIILKLKYDQSAKEHFANLNIPTVYGQYIYDCILISKNDANSKSSISHKYNTRHKGEIIPTHHRLKFYEKKPTYLGKKFFMYLPEKIKSEKNIDKFKKGLKEFIINNPMYSLDEFFHLCSQQN